MQLKVAILFMEQTFDCKSFLPFFITLKFICVSTDRGPVLFDGMCSGR